MGDENRATHHEGNGKQSEQIPIVLLVDDMMTNLMVGAGLMRKLGINADIASSGKKAIEQVAGTEYDIVFMDHMMPDMDGLETTKRIRLMGGKYAALPIVALTANMTGDTKELLLQGGMNDYLSKPIEREELMSVLHKWLPENKARSIANIQSDDASAALSPALRAVSELEGMDIELALRRVGGSQEALEETIKQLAHSFLDRVKKMAEFLSLNEMERFAIDAHGFKSSFANIGATRNAKLAAELEILAGAGNARICVDKFLAFAKKMEIFAADLTSIFPEQKNYAVEKGEITYLAQKMNETLDYLDDFETDDAMRCVTEMLAFTYSDETDRALNETKKAIAVYDHELAMQILQGIQNNLSLV